MGASLRVLVRVVLRRMKSGEKLDDILEEYPKLTDQQRAEVIEEAEKHRE